MKHLHILALALAFTQTSWAQTNQELVLDGRFEVYVAPQGGGGNNDEEGSTPSFDPYLNPNTGISIHHCRANAPKRPTLAIFPYVFIPMVARLLRAIKISTRITSPCNRAPNTNLLIGIKAP